MIVVPDLLNADEVGRVRDIVDAGDWVDGNVTAGNRAALVKRNRQLPEGGEATKAAGRIVLDALGRSALFIAAALPLRVFPPLFNRYEGGDGFGTHVDNAIRILRGSDFRLRTDLSATLFLSDPGDYDGGELVVADGPGIKLPAGHLLLYPASTLHRVEPVTAGVRTACFFWLQSMIRGHDDRALFFDLDRSIQALAGRVGEGDAEILRLTQVYHNLLRRLAEL